LPVFTVTAKSAQHQQKFMALQFLYQSSDQKCTTEIKPFSFDERDQLIPKRNAKPSGRTWSKNSGYQFHTSPVPASKKRLHTA
jgi:hypothetical protein